MDKKIILVTEDESRLRNVLKDKLTLEGFIVFEAKDGEEGLKLALSEYPDLMLVDIFMPKMDGLTMLRKIREDSRGKKIKFIILTNADETDKIAEAMQVAGVEDDKTFDYYVKSDIKMEDVIAKVKGKLG
ncbi:MAG: response regulator [Candidatus Taylorbacteria bacterium]